MNRDDAPRTLDNTDWNGVTVEIDSRSVSSVRSAEIPRDLFAPLDAESTTARPPAIE